MCGGNRPERLVKDSKNHVSTSGEVAATIIGGGQAAPAKGKRGLQKQVYDAEAELAKTRVISQA